MEQQKKYILKKQNPFDYYTKVGDPVEVRTTEKGLSGWNIPKRCFFADEYFLGWLIQEGFIEEVTPEPERWYILKNSDHGPNYAYSNNQSPEMVRAATLDKQAEIIVTKPISDDEVIIYVKYDYDLPYLSSEGTIKVTMSKTEYERMLKADLDLQLVEKKTDWEKELGVKKEPRKLYALYNDLTNNELRAVFIHPDHCVLKDRDKLIEFIEAK